VTIGAGSTDALLTKMGLTVSATDTVTWSPVTAATTDTPVAGSYFAYQGTLVLKLLLHLNKIIINIL
jgi:hypothetical protein